MKRKSGLLIFLAFMLIFAQLPGLQAVYAASGSENVQVTKSLNPTEIFVGGETEVTINVQGTPDQNVVKPNDVILIIDKSGSMAPTYGPNNGEDKMRNAKDAAKGFIDLMDLTKHRVGIVDYSTSASAFALTTDKTAAKNYINTIQASGSTATGAAIDKAMEMLRDHREDAQPVIILMTDGDATVPDSNPYGFAMEKAREAKEAGIVFYTIALLLPTENPVTSGPNKLMMDMATTAHHHHFVLGSVGLAEIYAAIVQEIGIASAYDVRVTDYISPEFEIVPDSYKDNIPQPTISGNSISWNFLELKNELLTFKYKIRHKQGAAVGDLPAGDQKINVGYKNYLGAQRQYTVTQPTVKVKHYAPIITSVDKDNGPIQGGEEVIIYGDHFRPNPVVNFGNIKLTSVNYVSENQLIVTAPAGTQGTVQIKVTNDDGQFATADYRYYATPEITTITPNEGPLEGGTKVVINGDYFMTGAQVLIDGKAATVTKVGKTELEITTPAGTTAKTVDVTVNNPDGTTVTATDSFTYIKGPEILAVDPSVGARTGGEQVKLTGERFVDGAKVYFNSTLVNSTFVSSQEISLITPVWSKADTVDVKVVNPNGQSATLTKGYTYEDPVPAITSVTPSTGPMAGGTVVIIKGDYFKTGAKVLWGGQEITDYTFVNSSEIRFKTPAWPNPELVSLKIINPDAKELEMRDVFQYLAPPDPTFASITPTTGLITGGTTVTLNGTNFPSDVKVYFDDHEVATESVAASRIVVKSPVWPSPETVDVSIQTSTGFRLSLPDAFEYLPLPKPPAPSITSITPSSGSVTGGNNATIKGLNFEKGLKLYFNDQELTYTFVSSSELRLRVPAWPKAESVTVRVTNPDDQSAELVNGYKFDPLPGPTLTAISPNSGPIEGGTTVRLTGTNFKNDSKVFLADEEVSSTFISATELRITTPAWGKSDVVDVKVQNADGQTALLANAYTFEVPPPPPAPVITEVIPNSGPQAGGTTVTIKGSNFFANSVVKFDDTIISSSLLSSSELRIKTPAWDSAATVKVTVISEDGQSASLDNAFTFIAPPPKPDPVVTSVSPNSLEIPGTGTLVTITGQHFQSGAKVFFNDTEIPATYLSQSQLRLRTPAWSIAENVNVTVENPDGKSGTLVDGFKFVTPPPPPAPIVTGASPNTALASKSSLITVIGENFVNGSRVAFGNTELATTYLSKTQLRVATPIWPNPETVTLSVINPDGQSGQLVDGFTFLQNPPPTVTSLSPNTGLISGGGQVTVSGSNFISGASVYFNGEEIAATYISATQLRIKVPSWPSAAAVDVQVINPDGQQSAILSGGYVYTAPAPKPAPIVTKLTPNVGGINGGTIVTVTGSNIQSGAKIEINGVVVDATYLSSSQLRFRTPASAVTGPVPVRIINPDGQASEILVDGFTYQ